MVASIGQTYHQKTVQEEKNTLAEARERIERKKIVEFKDSINTHFIMVSSELKTTKYLHHY
jgi:hypothetical protein